MKRVRNITLSAFLLFSGLFCGCKDIVVPSDVMKEKTMVSFLKDAYTLEGFYAIETAFHYDTLHPQMLASYDSLLASYSLTREDFERSVDWYSRHPELYQKVHQEVIDQLDQEMSVSNE